MWADILRCASSSLRLLSLSMSGSIRHWHRSFNGRYTAGMTTATNTQSDANGLHYDIVIVGGGMVGAALACALAPAGVHIAILDQRQFDGETAGSGAFEPRVSAITPASAQFLSDIGAW